MTNFFVPPTDAPAHPLDDPGDHGAPLALPPAAPISPPPGKLTKAAAKRHRELTELLHQPPEALRDADFVHDLRVGARRLGEVARLLEKGKGFMDKPTARAVDSSLKGLRRSMGDLRDADVTREHLLKWRMPGPVKHVARELADALEARRSTLETAGRASMTSASVTGTMVVLARVLQQGLPERAAATEQQLSAAVERQLQRREKQMRKAFGQAARKQTAESLHAARITVKKLRYVMELADEAGLEKGARQKVRVLKQMQQLLGDHHDAHVIVEQVQKHLKDRRDKPIRGLAPAWRKWHLLMERAQAQRASMFFTKSYAWINSKA